MSNYSQGYRVSLVAASVILMTGCSTITSTLSSTIDKLNPLNYITSELDKNRPQPITEPLINSLAIEPVSLPSTKIPSASLEQARDSYLKLMQSTSAPNLIAESLQRLAEIESMIADNELIDDNTESMNQHLNLAASYYQRLLSQYPDKIEATKIQYQLARTLELAGQQDLSNELLTEITQFKGTDFEVVEASFRMAEDAYRRKSYTTALTLYDQVLSHENNPQSGQLNSFYNSALFKRGWTYFKKQDYDLGVKDFLELLNIIYKSPESRTQTENTLILETYRVTALSLSYMDGAKSLARHFSTHGHTEFESELYLSLANLFSSQERFQDTAITYFTFVEANPYNKLAPAFEHKGIDVLAKSGFIDLILKAKESFVIHYQSNAPYWEQSGLQRSAEVSTWLYSNLEDVINYHHTQAQESKKAADYKTAAKWYRVFLESFQDHPKVDDKRWLLAETLNDAGERLASINEYQILAYEENNLSEDRKEEAGFRVILGRQHQFATLENAKNGISRDAIAQSRKALIQAGLTFKNQFPNSKRAAIVIAQTIELQLGDGQTEVAVALARTMDDTPWATVPHKKRAREIIANGEFDLKHYQLAEVAFTLIFNTDQYPANKMSDFHARRAQAIYKQAEAFKENKQYDKAINQFLRLGSIEPNSKERVSAEFDAATLLLEIKSYRRAVTVLESFIKNYPNHTLSASIPAKLIIAYEALGDWQGAAKQYELVAATTKDSTLARTATWQAATSWMKLEDIESKNKSVALWKKYIKQFDEPYDLSLEARNNLIQLYGAQKIKWKQDFWRRKIILTVDSHQLKDVRARSLAAQSQLSLTTDIFTEYQAIRLTQPLRRSLTKKRKKLDAALKGYSKVIDYNIQLATTESGHRIGELYALLALSILESDRPKGMSEIELEEYETLLEERVFPMEDQAIEAFEANVSLTKSSVWDSWIRDSFSELELLLPARYKKPEIIDDYAKSP